MSNSSNSGYEGQTSQHRREKMGQPGYDAFGFPRPQRTTMQPSSSSGCCVIAIGAVLALSSFGAICALAKGEHSKPLSSEKSPLPIENQVKDTEPGERLKILRENIQP